MGEDEERKRREKDGESSDLLSDSFGSVFDEEERGVFLGHGVRCQCRRLRVTARSTTNSDIPGTHCTGTRLISFDFAGETGAGQDLGAVHTECMQRRDAGSTRVHTRQYQHSYALRRAH
eukprot:2145554-Rhodomonas_salina.4